MCRSRWCRLCGDAEKMGPHAGKITPEIIRRFNRKFNPMVEDENGEKIRKPYRCPRSGSRYTLADCFCDERRYQWKCSVNDNPMPYRISNVELRERIAHRNQPAQEPETEAGSKTIRRSRFRRCKFSLPPHERPRED